MTEWTQPKYWDAVAMAINSLAHHNKQFDWGFPVGVKQSADYELCPALTLPDGGANYECNGATCMVVCEQGKIALGKRRIKCRWTRKKGFFWKTVSQIKHGKYPISQGP